MSEEAPLRDRSHIEKTLMLNEDKPSDDFSGNRRQEPGRRGRMGWGEPLASGHAEPGAGALQPWRRALDLGGFLEEAP